MSRLSIDLPVLRTWWGSEYQIDWIFQRRVFRAVRRDNGVLLEHAEPEELWKLIRADQAGASCPEGES